jgi:hypothetical protein
MPLDNIDTNNDGTDKNEKFVVDGADSNLFSALREPKADGFVTMLTRLSCYILYYMISTTTMHAFLV